MNSTLGYFIKITTRKIGLSCHLGNPNGAKKRHMAKFALDHSSLCVCSKNTTATGCCRLRESQAHKYLAVRTRLLMLIATAAFRIFNNFFKATRASATAGVSAGLSSSLSHHDTLGASSTGSQSGAAKSPLCDDEEGTVLRCAFSGNFHALDIDDDADGDVFEDPAVEREKRRKRKQRRRAWQSRTAAANATRDLGVVRADSSARVDRVNEKMLPSPEDTNDESEGISQATLAEQCPKSVTCRRPVDVAITSPRDKECASRSGGLDEAATDSGKISDRDNFVNRHGNSNHEGVGKREPGLVQALAIKSAELAELSEVPNLLRDESVGAVVLAATTTTAVSTEDIAKTGETGQEKRCGVGIFGVPEMTITGRRLNREVCTLALSYELVSGRQNEKHLGFTIITLFSMFAAGRWLAS